MPGRKRGISRGLVVLELAKSLFILKLEADSYDMVSLVLPTESFFPSNV